eukprot:3640390-Amphidinium_carterae.2
MVHLGMQLTKLSEDYGKCDQKLGSKQGACQHMFTTSLRKLQVKQMIHDSVFNRPLWPTQWCIYGSREMGESESIGSDTSIIDCSHLW